MPNPIHKLPMERTMTTALLEALKCQDACLHYNLHEIPYSVRREVTVLIASSGAMADRNATRVFAS